MKITVFSFAIIVLLASLAPVSGVAMEIELREDHPREYVVQEGDTLWDIAGRFLTRPWQWPAIWQANPQIDDPHLIFPGDVISLVFIDGEPRLVAGPVDEEAVVDDSIRRLSPRIRREPLVGPVSTIPLDAIEPFLRFPRVVSEEEFERLPYVIANREQRVFSGTGDRTYVRGMDDARVGDQVVVARLTYQFEDRSQENGTNQLRRNRMRQPGQVPAWERPAGPIWRSISEGIDGVGYPIIGYELWEAARGEVVRTGDPTIIQLTSGRREVMEGDLVVPVDTYVPEANFFPQAMDQIPENARVLAITEAQYGVGHFQIAAISVGSSDGVEPGHTFSAFRPGQRIRDQRYSLMSRAAFREPEKRYVDLPDEYAGTIMVFRTFDRVSYAIVLDGMNAVRNNDILRHPDDRL